MANAATARMAAACCRFTREDLPAALGGAAGSVEVAHADGTTQAIDREYLVPRADRDREAIVEELGRRHEELALVGDDVADEVRQPTVGEGNVCATVEDDDLRLFVEAAETRCARGASCDSADDQDTSTRH